MHLISFFSVSGKIILGISIKYRGKERESIQAPTSFRDYKNQELSIYLITPRTGAEVEWLTSAPDSRWGMKAPAEPSFEKDPAEPGF